MRYYVDLDAVVALYLRLSTSVTWKMLDAVSLARGGCLHYVAFNRRPLPRTGAPWRSRVPPRCLSLRGPTGDGDLPAGKNYQVRTILASAAYS
jgi:hypothetical protein